MTGHRPALACRAAMIAIVRGRVPTGEHLVEMARIARLVAPRVAIAAPARPTAVPARPVVTENVVLALRTAIVVSVGRPAATAVPADRATASVAIRSRAMRRAGTVHRAMVHRVETAHHAKGHRVMVQDVAVLAAGRGRGTAIVVRAHRVTATGDSGVMTAETARAEGPPANGVSRDSVRRDRAGLERVGLRSRGGIGVPTGRGIRAATTVRSVRSPAAAPIVVGARIAGRASGPARRVASGTAEMTAGTTAEMMGVVAATGTVRVGRAGTPSRRIARRTRSSPRRSPRGTSIRRHATS
ncbi:hypothetical protein J2Y69_001953 [Microbacterium resistens]|uniref:Uncharacterized protein n=1 Tax=Microbacterium resistens TaxID=156977 RepID=A0ABU1SCL1_9MICO|nr:hypothetical protein [Microbacterium resistens]MDR6867350.1 hypothetical protein [Microbacterium resistens]